MKQNNNVSGIILTAAKADITICEVFGDLPTGLIPVNGKPIVFYILQQFLDNNIFDIYIGIDYKSEKLEAIVNLYFKNKLKINYIYTPKEKGVGNSLLKILEYVSSEKVVINLGDTFIKDLKFEKLDDMIIVSKDFIEEEKWSLVEEKKNKLSFFNKINLDINSDNYYVITGFYILNHKSYILKNLFKFTNNENLQITDILNLYQEKYKLKIEVNQNWLDFGHIDKYHTSKKKLIQSRGFNSLSYNDLLGTITKKSKNIEKFIHEIKWQLNLPNDLKVLSPRILGYSLCKYNAYVEMEFYSYPTLSEIWLFSDWNERLYFSIIDKLFKILDLFRKHKQEVTINSYKLMYIDKTKERIKKIDNRMILDFMEKEYIIINNKKFKNIKVLENEIFRLVNYLFDENDNCFMHGDFCLSNILYDARSGIFRLIDPRGIWGETPYGDIKYDIAKLRHSICGDYDYIVNDLFQLNIDNKENHIQYHIYNSNKDKVKQYFDKKVNSLYDVNHIKLIEGLLFLSMIPLHKDSEKRQILMYVKAIELFNSIM